MTAFSFGNRSNEHGVAPHGRTMGRAAEHGARASRDSTHRRGAITVLVAVLLVVFLAAALFALDVSYINTVTFETRTVADFAARAGGEALSQGQSNSDASKIIKQVGLSNRVAGVPLVISDADIVFGTAKPDLSTGRYTFTPNGTPTNAVRVTAQRTSESSSGSVSLMVGNVFGTKSFQPAKSATACGGPRDVCVVIDRSGSMKKNDAGPPGGPSMTRIAAAKQACTQFRKAINDTVDIELLGLVSFDDTANLESNLSSNYTQFDSKVAALTTGSGTNISAGIDRAVIMMKSGLTRPEAAPVIIVMTDGNWNKGRDPSLAAKDAVAQIPNLTIHTVTFSDDAEISDMVSVAKIGRGQHFHADDVADLTSTFVKLAGLAAIRLIE